MSTAHTMARRERRMEDKYAQSLMGVRVGFPSEMFRLGGSLIFSPNKTCGWTKKKTTGMQQMYNRNDERINWLSSWRHGVGLLEGPQLSQNYNCIKKHHLPAMLNVDNALKSHETNTAGKNQFKIHQKRSIAEILWDSSPKNRKYLEEKLTELKSQMPWGWNKCSHLNGFFRNFKH